MAADADRELVARQLGRPPRAFLRVAVRCPWGKPAVVEQAPYDADGEPFPTTYWLTCRTLVAAVSRVEAAGGVERWSAAVVDDAELATSLEQATEEQRAVRRELAAGRTGVDGGASLDLGIGGSRNPVRLKCLHAHAAFALARPGYVLGERILGELDGPWPVRRCCMEDPVWHRPVMAVDVENARRDWEVGWRRLQEEARDSDDPRTVERLSRQVDVVTEELRRRVGATFSLAELADAYDTSDPWIRAAVGERAATPGWPRTLSLVGDAAFHLYARGAVDYAP